MMKSFITIILVLLFFVTVEVLSASLDRNLWQFKSMINHKGYSMFDYNGYGCWCGSGNHGTLAFDETDRCCLIHDQCYDRISGGFFGCSPKLVTYAWKAQPNRVIVCTDSLGTCDRNTCECDKAAADCYAKHRSTYNPSFINSGNKTNCNA